MDLGTFGGHESLALTLNDEREIVGLASNAIPDPLALFLGGTQTRAFLGARRCVARPGYSWWPMVDLNTLIPKNSGAPLYEASNINERGEIVAGGLPAGCGDPSSFGHVYLLIPCDENHPNIEGCDYSPVEVSTVAASHDAEAAPQKQLTPQEISRIRALLMNRHRGFTPGTLH